MLWKCCTQYASTFGKLSSGHRTGKGQFSFQSQRKAMAKNAQTTIALVSHTSKVMLKMMVQWVKCLPTMQETRVQSLGQEDLLGKEMATHSSTLAWKIPQMEKPGRLQSMGSQRVGHNWVASPSLVLGSSDLNWSLSLAFLLLQFADGRLWDFSISIILWAISYNKSFNLFLYVSSLSVENPD